MLLPSLRGDIDEDVYKPVREMDGLNTASLILCNDPSSLHMMNPIDLIASLNNPDNEYAKSHRDVYDLPVKEIDGLDTASLILGNDPGSLHTTNPIDLIAILNSSDDKYAKSHWDVYDSPVKRNGWFRYG